MGRESISWSGRPLFGPPVVDPQASPIFAGGRGQASTGARDELVSALAACYSHQAGSQGLSYRRGATQTRLQGLLARGRGHQPHTNDAQMTPLLT